MGRLFHKLETYFGLIEYLSRIRLELQRVHPKRSTNRLGAYLIENKVLTKGLLVHIRSCCYAEVGLQTIAPGGYWLAQQACVVRKLGSLCG